MRSSLSLRLGLVVAAAALTGPAHAQIKFADFDPAPAATLKSKDIAFQEAKDRADLKHGTLLSLKLNNGSNVIGHVVRIDQKTKTLFLRTKAGEAPVAYAENDIKKIDKATREIDPADPIMRASFGSGEWRDLGTGLEENNSGVVRIKRQRATPAIKPAALNPRNENKIKPAIDEANTQSQNVVQPEITRQVFYNGTQRSVIYISNVVSPGEREILDQLQKSENDLMALANQQEQREVAITQEMFMQEERLKTLALINQTMRNENNVNYPYPPPVIYNDNNSNYSYASGARHKGVVTLLPHPVSPPVSLVDRMPPVDPQALSKARDHMAQLMRTHAIYEDGRIVAVVAK